LKGKFSLLYMGINLYLVLLAKSVRTLVFGLISMLIPIYLINLKYSRRKMELKLDWMKVAKQYYEVYEEVSK